MQNRPKKMIIASEKKVTKKAKKRAKMNKKKSQHGANTKFYKENIETKNLKKNFAKIKIDFYFLKLKKSLFFPSLAHDSIIASDNSQFTRITSIEQRRQYKTEFDKDYSDYMKLHPEIERVSRRFAQLEESLRNTDHKNQRYKVSI